MTGNHIGYEGVQGNAEFFPLLLQGGYSPTHQLIVRNGLFAVPNAKRQYREVVYH
jgi:hypothetical protein